MLLSSCQIVIDNIKNKYNLTNIDISIRTGVAKATIDKITSGKTKMCKIKHWKSCEKPLKNLMKFQNL